MEIIIKLLNTDGTKTQQTLRSIPLFSELSIAQLRELTKISRLKPFNKNEMIFLEGDYYKGFYILLKGTAKIFKVTTEGKESVVHIAKPLSTFADIPLFEGRDYPVNAQALEESLTLFIPKEGFIDLIKANPEISLKMLAGFAKRLKALVIQVEELSTMEVKNRVAKYLLKEVKKNKTDKLPEPYIKLTVPKSIIASYLGTITETLSRTFKKLESEGIIRSKGKKVFITDYKKLKRLAE